MNTKSNVIPLPLKHKFLCVSDIPSPDNPTPSLEEQIRLFPPSLELVIDLILMDFDYGAQMDANTAKALRILIIMINRINKALENHHV
jgi:hypothetical protein